MINYNQLVIISLLSVSLLLCRPVWAQSNVSDGPGQRLSPSIGLLFIVLIVTLFFIGIFSVYVRRCTEIPSTVVGSRTIAGSVGRLRRAARGLDPEVVESFPTFDYSAVKTAKIGRGALECAVCLTEFEDDDTLRLIPKCDHVFHPECIDTWLAGHVTCPVCRANLTEPAGSELSTSQDDDTQNDTVMDVSENESTTSNDVEECESMERPLQGRVRRSRSVMGSISIGRPRWIGKLKRSFSTGHMAAVQQSGDTERFTLRLPTEVRNQLMSGKLGRSTSLVILPRESSTKKGYRFGPEEGPIKGRSKSVRSDGIITKSDQWVFSLAPPFISRASIARAQKEVAFNSIKGGSGTGTGTGTGTVRGSIRGDSSMLPV